MADVVFHLLHEKGVGGFVKNVYIAREGKKDIVHDALLYLEKKDNQYYKSTMRHLRKMAKSVGRYDSPFIRYRLEGYKFGELRPWGHRFFFFMRYGDNIIVFDYLKKKTDRLPPRLLKKVNERYEIYGKAFIQQFGRKA